MNVTGDRTVEHGLATVGYDDEGVADPELGHRPRRRARRLPARPVDGRTCKPELNDGRSNGCAYADSPGHIPIQRMANVSLQPGADGPSTDGPDRPGRARASTSSATSRGRSTCSASTSSSPASGSTGSRTASSAGQLRDVGLPGDHDRLLGLDGGGRRPGDLGARRRVQLRQGPARAGRRGQPRLPDVAVPRRPHPQHHRRGRPLMTSPRTTAQQLVEHALATSTADDCIAIVRDATSANLRWANNTLTTNGVMHGRRRHRDLASSAAPAASPPARSPAAPPPTDQVTALVAGRRRRRPRRLARRGRRRAGRRRRRSPTGTTRPATTDIDVYDAFAPALGEAFGRADGRGPGALRLRQPRGHHDLPRLVHRACGCATSSRPATTAAPARTPT